MKLSQLIKESDVEDIVSLTKLVDEYLAKGEIVKPEYERLKNQLNRLIEREGRNISETYNHGQASTYQQINDDAIWDLSYGIPGSTNEVLSLKKKLDKCKNLSHVHAKALHSSLTDFYNRWSSVSLKMKELKGKVVTTTQKRAEAKEVKEQIFQKKFTDASTLVKVLETYIEAYKQRAREISTDRFNRLYDNLKTHDFDLNKIAQKPNGKMSRTQYISAQSTRNTYFQLFVQVPTKDETTILKLDEQRKNSWIQQEVDGAEAAYHAYVRKMIEKIGKPVTFAEITGNPWTGSTLTVKCNDGTEQVWSTQMIINFSKYDLMFNQFPSRQIK